jgi:hypothetical protein
MLRTAVLVAASVFAVSLHAQEQVYLYVKYKDAAGESVRYRLDCVDADCNVDTAAGERRLTLNADQKKSLLEALQAEAGHFVVAIDPAPGGSLMKVKFRYDAPLKRLQIERRIPVERPASLTPEMRQVMAIHFGLDLSKPVFSGPAKGAEPQAGPPAAGPAK